MTRSLTESDWKIFRQLREVALERFCQRVLAEVQQVASDSARSFHERYLAIFRHIHDHDAELADAFNNPRRSTALTQLTRIQLHELLTAEEMAAFSDEIRETVQRLLKYSRGS